MIAERPIAALATARGAGAIAIVRLSGDGAFAIADALCRHAPTLPSALPDRSFRLYRLRDPRDGSMLDEAVVLVFRAPRSYTGEDTVEFQVHGGAASCDRILSALFSCGAAPAAPGEFTRRAFLNGRISLDRAEAVMDIVSARGESAARAAAEQLAGALGRLVDSLYGNLVALCADVEATLDFTDEEAEGLMPVKSFRERALGIAAEARRIAASAARGRILREGALVVLSGPPNAGKSTLFNALLGSGRAIVDSQAGTTRDSLEEAVSIGGVAVRLVDTAGLRENAAGAAEREGVERARKAADNADLVLLCREAGAAAGETAPDGSGCDCVQQRRKRLVVWTKTDLVPGFAATPDSAAVSAATGSGLDDLRGKIASLVGADPSAAREVPVSERHALLLESAAAMIDNAVAIWGDGMGDTVVPAASRLRAAACELGRITGRTWSDDLLDAVFSRFCVGK